MLTAGTLAATLLSATVSILGAERPDRITPVHAIHSEAEIECETCHAGVSESTSALDDLRPGHDVCADCHDVEDDAECASCHTNPEDPVARERAPVVAERFAHAVHVESIGCASCHGAATAEPALPMKATCRSCHATAADLTDCHVCHGPTERLVPVSHQPSWRSFHGLAAHTDEASCANCHTKSDCEDCHAGDNVRPRSHGLNYAFEHVLDARGNELACATCHVEPAFCADCHLAENVLPESHSRGDWLLDVPGGGRHAEAARFELETCVACHDAGTSAPTCAECHGR